MNASNELTTQIETLHHRLEARPALSAQSRPGALSAAPVASHVQQVLQEGGRALKAWQESAEGQAKLAAMQGYSLEQVRAELSNLLLGPVLAPALTLAAQQREVSEDDIPFPIKSVSVGLSGELDLGVGVYGSIGYAANLNDLSGTSAVYLCGAFLEGIVEGGAVGLQFGAWANDIDDLAGYYNGQTIDIDDFGGVAGWLFEQDESVAGACVDTLIGEDDGLAEIEFYMLTFDITHLPVAQADAAHMLILTTLECLNTNEVGHDEVYFTFTPDGGSATYRYPTWDSYAMTADQNASEHLWNVGRSVKFNSYVNIALQDGNDSLGNFTFHLTDFSGPGTTHSQNQDRKGTISNGWNEISYTFTAQLIY